MTQDIAELIHGHDELETQVSELSALSAAAARMEPLSGTAHSILESVPQTITRVQEEIRIVRLRLAAQGFWMSSL